jgi:pre-mRNA-splicing factor 38A
MATGDNINDNASDMHAGAFYLRLVGKPDEVYRYIEPLFNDYRKCRLQIAGGNYTLTYV